jgi:NADPH-dependent ferric siderophore reductase
MPRDGKSIARIANYKQALAVWWNLSRIEALALASYPKVVGAWGMRPSYMWAHGENETVGQIRKFWSNLNRYTRILG